MTPLPTNMIVAKELLNSSSTCSSRSEVAAVSNGAGMVFVAASVCAFLAGLLVTQPTRSAPPRGYTTFHPRSTPLTFQLPWYWVKGSHAGTVFFAQSDDGTASMGLQVEPFPDANFHDLVRHATL